MRWTRRTSLMAVAAMLTTGLAGCMLPVDPDGTLDGVRGDVLTVGVTSAKNRAAVSADGDASGVEPDLMRGFADTLGADVVFVEGSEAELVDLLERDALDVAIGGFLDETPWVDKAATTLPYAETTGPTGKTQKHVMLVPLGENAMLLALDRYLTTAEGER